MSSKAKARPKKASVSRQQSSPFANSELLHVEFEIRGKVQGVHFRKYTQTKAKEFGLRGWVQNTDEGTVVGCIEGPRLKTDMMKDWLRRIGSPKSKITASEFKNIKLINEHTFEEFMIIK